MKELYPNRVAQLVHSLRLHSVLHLLQCHPFVLESSLEVLIIYLAMELEAADGSTRQLASVHLCYC